MSDRPNILIFMTDQEQAQVVTSASPCRTPNADRLAAAGLQFTHAFTVSAHCCPSRASFMTGLHPTRHGVYNNVLNPPAINRAPFSHVQHFSQALSAAGYRMAYSGKWHVSAEQDPAAFGWEETPYISAKAHAFYENDWNVWMHPTNRQDSAKEKHPGEILRPGWGTYELYGTSKRSLEETHDYKIVESGIAAMRNLAETGEPWCVFIGPHGPHDPYVIPAKYAEMYNPDDVVLPPSYSDSLVDKPGIYRRLRRQVWGQLTEAEAREAVAHYWGYCSMMDDLLGMTLAALDETGQAANTLVLFVSDHGDYMGAHGLFMKGVAAFDEAYRIPCIIRWPKGIQTPGRSVDALVSIADFAPTFMELAGCPVDSDLNGRSLTPFFQNTGLDWRKALYMQMNGVELYFTQRTVRTTDYKYVFNGFDEDELYDLRRDPYECRNLATESAYQHVVKEMVTLLWQMAQSSNDTLLSPYPTVALIPYGPLQGWNGN